MALEDVRKCALPVHRSHDPGFLLGSEATRRLFYVVRRQEVNRFVEVNSNLLGNGSPSLALRRHDLVVVQHKELIDRPTATPLRVDRTLGSQRLYPEFLVQRSDERGR